MTSLFSTPTLLDGAMGTALIAQGLAFETPAETWLLTRPEELRGVHRAHVQAGAQVLLTCTFNLAAPRLGSLDVPELARRAVELAREAGGLQIAGDLGPSWVFQPGRPAPPPDPVEAAYARAAEALAAAGADLLWVESQWSAAEAGLALRAARRTGLPVVVTFSLSQAGGALRAPDGTAAEALLRAAAEGGAAAVGVNCVPADAALIALARWATSPGALPVPLVMKPSPGLPGAVPSPQAFAAAVRPAVEAGARVVGGCCGTGAAHLRALGALLDEARLLRS